MIAIDVLICVLLIGLFYFMNLTGILPIFVCIIIGILLHFVSEVVLQVIKIKEEEEKLIQDQENRIQNVIEKFDDISFSYDFIEDFLNCLSDFLRKKKVLLEISNDSFIKNEVYDAEDYLVRLSERLETKIKILEAVDQHDTEYDAVIEDIEKIVSITQDYVDGIGKLLVEVGRSEDDDLNDEKKRKLSESTERLKKIKEQSSSLFEDDSDEGLFVTTSSKSKIGI